MAHRFRLLGATVASCAAAVLMLTGADATPAPTTSSPTTGPTTAGPSEPPAVTASPSATTTPTPPTATVTLDSVLPDRVVEDTDLLAVRGTADPGSQVEVSTQHDDRDVVRRVVVVAGEDGTWVSSHLFRRPGAVSVWASVGEESTDALTVTVLDRTNRITTTATVVPGLARWHVEGVVSHVTDSVPLRVQVRRGGRWRLVRETATGPDGAYRFRIPTRWPGSARYRTVATVTDRDVERSAAHRVSIVKRLRASVDSVTADDLSASYRRGCPVGPERLRRVRFVHQRYAGSLAWGRIVVREGSAVRWTKGVFGKALSSGFRFREIRPVEAYDGSDPASMAADNTSAFNCRHVTGNPYALSPHAYGTAFDLNPRRNPYQDVTGTWWPSGSKSWRDRTNRRTGMLFRDSPVTVAFRDRGLQWGGFWSHPDYQHFDP